MECGADRVKAALRDKRRQEAVARRQKLLAGEPGSLVTVEERQKIWKHFEDRGVSYAQALPQAERIVAQFEKIRADERRLVQPVNGQGLLVPGGRLIISPEEARQQAMAR